MKLISISSEPKGLFPHTKDGSGVIFFRSGLNFIFGRKDSNADAKESLNAIGKSLFLDLIDFCLLSSFDKRNVRLFEAKNHLADYAVVLKFGCDGKEYTIKRSANTPSMTQFGETGALDSFSDIEILKPILARTILGERIRKEGNSLSFRTLLSFFLKIHKDKTKQFTDPIKFSSHDSLARLVPYHLFLLGIDNSLSLRNASLLEQSKSLTDAITQIRQFAEKKYQLDVAEVESEVDGLKSEVNSLQENADAFKLADTYEDVEAEANTLTVTIKNLVAQNFADSDKISLYEESYRLKDDPQLAWNVSRIYSDLNEQLGVQVGIALSDALAFRKALSDSRKDFLSDEIGSLKILIESRNLQIKELEDERALKFKFLEAKNAISDLTQAFHAINEKRRKISELEGKVKLYNDLKKEKSDNRAERTQLERAMIELLEVAKEKIARFRAIFTEVYGSAYPSGAAKSYFTLTVDPKKDAKTILDVKIPGMRSEGKNQGRTLIYDLSVVVNGIKEGLHLPRFLAHDGIFDGMDKAHFVGICNLISSLVEQNTEIQYIIPLNEEGTLTEQFGNVEGFTSEEIAERAILVLTPKRKLLGVNFG